MAQEVTRIADPAAFAAATKVSRETLARLNLYESLLKVWQPRINLVANPTLIDVWHRHFYDSAQLLRLIPAEARALVDLGSGAGFPGLVLAILLDSQGWPPAVGQAGDGGQNAGDARRYVLVESDRRKCAFLREVARQTGTAVDILSTRIENPETHVKVGKADVVTARALAPLDRLFDLAQPMFKAEAVGLFLKGRNAEAEIGAARARWEFSAELVPSVTAEDASVVVVRELRRR